MREIKFRGKRIDNGKWVHGWYAPIEGKGFFIFEEWLIGLYEWEVSPKTVGQYTGLKDKDGKEIYEGDIVEIYDAELDEKYIAKIEYDKDCFVAKTNDGYKYSLWNIRKNIKIIGNIYKNPELLKEK